LLFRVPEGGVNGIDGGNRQRHLAKSLENWQQGTANWEWGQMNLLRGSGNQPQILTDQHGISFDRLIRGDPWPIFYS
jgi:hypothetical protein